MVPQSNYRKQFHYQNYTEQLLGLLRKHSPTYSNMHLLEFSIHLSIVFTRLALKNTTKYTYEPQTPPHTHTHVRARAHTHILVFVHSQMTGCPKSDKGGSQFPHSLFFNYPINRSSFLEVPSFSKDVMLRLVRKAF